MNLKCVKFALPLFCNYVVEKTLPLALSQGRYLFISFVVQRHHPSKLLSMPPKRKAAAKKTEAEEEPKRKSARKQTADDKAVAEPKAKSPRKQKGADKAEAEPTQKKAKSEEAEETQTPKEPKGKAKAKKPVERVKIDLSSADFSNGGTTKDGRKWNVKIASWNINGIRAWLDKNGPSYLEQEKPDVLCVQETKCNTELIPDEAKPAGYHPFFSSAEIEGYAGTGMYCKEKPINVTYGLGIKKHDEEGRVITAEFSKYFLVTAYVPNAGRGLPRLAYRTKEWDKDFTAYLKKLDAKKPVIMCGDLNVAHLEIDLKNPKTNKKTAGFTQEERDGFTDLLNEGFVDSFRHLYPDQEEAFSFWTYMGNARSKNVGWRLDYFVISDRLTKDLCDNVIRKDVMGSDHAPIVLMLAL